MRIISPQDQPVEKWRAGVESRMLLSAANGSLSLCLFEQWVAPGGGAPSHWHTVEEVLSIIEGTAECWVGDDRVELSVGQSVIVPALAKHRFRNAGATTLHLRALLAAPVFEATFEGSDSPVRRWLPGAELQG